MIVVVLAATAGAAWGGFLARHAEAGHTIANGDCWQTGTPYTCRTNWGGTDSTLYVRVEDNVSASASHLAFAISQAVASWPTAHAKMSMSQQTQVNGETYAYLYVGRNTDTSLGLDYLTAGVTWNCKASGFCSNMAQSMNIYKSNIWLNVDVMTIARGAFANQGTTAHELGHAVGLFHHNTNSGAIMYTPWTSRTVNGPTAIDVGALPDCVSSSSNGIRCIYHWTN